MYKWGEILHYFISTFIDMQWQVRSELERKGCKIRTGCGVSTISTNDEGENVFFFFFFSVTYSLCFTLFGVSEQCIRIKEWLVSLDSNNCHQ